MSEFPPLRYGVLGAANIARQFIRGMEGSPLATINAVASRTPEKAQAFATEMGIPRAHGSYDALLADPDIEAIYIPLPNHLHAEWAIKACAAGKHVLCEKPLSVTAADARAMFAAARAHNVRLVEAYPYMSQPQTLRLRELLAEGAIGRVQIVTAAFGFCITTPEGAPKVDPKNIRLDPTAGGGALLDAGTYAMSLARIAAGEAPTRVLALAKYTQTGVDQTVAATLQFPGGAFGQVTTSLSTAGHRYAVVVGESGVIETGYANHAPAGATTLPLRIKRGPAGPLPFETEEIPAGDGFRAEGDSFARMVRLGAEHWNGASEAESIDTVRALQAISKSALTGEWITLENDS